MRLRPIILGLAVILSSYEHAKAAAMYTIAPIDFGVGFRTGAVAINANGTVAGAYAPDGSNDANLIRFTNGTFDDLGPLLEIYLNDINAAGDMAVGGSIYTDLGGYMSLGDLGGGFTRAFAINDAGIVAGQSALAGATEANRAFRWMEVGGMVALELPAGSSGTRAFGINEMGDIVGQSGRGVGNAPRAVLWPTTGGVIEIGPSNLTRATDINDAGVIVGEAGLFSAYYFLNGQTTYLGNLAGLLDGTTIPRALNDHGQVVGSSTDLNEFFEVVTRAFLWDESNGLQNLNDLIPADSGWVLGTAFDINNTGQIVGTGVFEGRSIGFLLTPIPEPALPLLATLAALVFLVRRRR